MNEFPETRKSVAEASVSTQAELNEVSWQKWISKGKDQDVARRKKFLLALCFLVPAEFFSVSGLSHYDRKVQSLNCLLGRKGLSQIGQLVANNSRAFSGISFLYFASPAITLQRDLPRPKQWVIPPHSDATILSMK